MTRFAVLVVGPAVGLAVGCDDGGGTPIEPTSGTWTYVEGEVFDDSCRYGDPETSPMGTFALVNNGNGTMTITPGGEPSFQCTLSGASFTCPDRYDSDTPVPTVDAVINLHVTAYGTFSSSRAAAGHQRATASCTGTQCDLAAAALGVPFPCSFSVRYTASLATT